MSPASRSRGWALASAALVVALSWTVRELHAVRVARDPAAPGAGWFSTDPDGLYHMRRLERALAARDAAKSGPLVAARDPFLAFPDELDRGGPRIPWPPYYTAALHAACAPFAPQEPARREVFVEHVVASVPQHLGAATSGLALLVGWSLAGPAAGAFAGLYHAFAFGSLRYGHGGNGDHHAWVALWNLALLALASRALGGARGRAVMRAVMWRTWALGALAGAVAGLLLGSWVAALLYVGAVQLALLYPARSPERGRERARFALAFHLAAALALAPALLATRDGMRPFSVVELSWFHPLELALAGALVVWVQARRPAAGRVLLALAALTLAALLSRVGSGVLEGLRWLAASNAFMAFVTESRPLVGGGAGAAVFKYLGFGVLALPVCWLALAREARRDASPDARSAGERWVPWLVATPLLVAQALLQRRFADACVGPAAVVLGAGFACAARRLARGLPRFGPRGPALAPRRTALVFGLGALGALALQPGTVRASVARALERGRPEAPERTRARLHRRLFEWVRAHTPAPGAPPEYSVLAQWDLGHAIEWAARRPTVASGFGLYLGADSYLDPWRFFLAEDAGAARAVLERRRVRYVVMTSTFQRNLATSWRLVRGRDVDDRRDAGELSGWTRTLAARLLAEGGGPVRDLGDDAFPDPGFLRLVHVAPERDPTTRGRLGASPAGWVFEVVPGAELVARGRAGSVLDVRVRVRYAAAAHELAWRARARAGPDGVARVRVPYATGEPNGDGRVEDGVRWTFEGRRGTAQVPWSALRAGGTVELD